MSSSGLRHAWRRLATFGDGPRSEFLSNVAGLVDAGIPVYDALQEMGRAFRKGGDPRAEIVTDIAARLERGSSAAEAFRPWLAPHEAMILDAATRGVELGAALRNAAYLTESRKRILGAVLGALGYPAVLLGVGAGMLLVFAYQVIPTLAKLIAAERWSGLGAVYLALSHLVRDHGLWILAGLVAALVMISRSLPRWKPGVARAWLDRRLPPWNLFQIYNGALLLVSLSIMMRSGIPMADAVGILWDNTPAAWLRAHLGRIRRRLEEGGGVRLAALDSPVFPGDIRIAIALFDRFSEPDKAMERLGRQAVESAERSARKIGALANAAVLLLVGGLIGGVIPAVMSVVMEFYQQATTSMRM